MKVVHLSTHDISGGAARAAYRLHSGLRRLGHDSYMVVAHRRGDDCTVKRFNPPMDLPSRLRRRLRRERITRGFARYRDSRPAGYELFSDDRSQYGAAVVSQLPPCDVINLHWIAGFMNYDSFFAQVPQDIPIVWTLHDINPFTGGCHYDHGCGKYTDRCGACPQLGSRDTGDLSEEIWQRKREAFEQIEPARLRIVTPSRWLASEAERSTLFGRFPVSAIPYGLDTDVFSPRDRCLARDALEVPEEAGVVLFAAASVGNRRKGFALLAQALTSLNDLSNLFLISLGRGRPIVDSKIPHLHLGHIENDRLLSLVYSAADVFVIPSLQEAFGQTALEAMACGTPAVGFAIGGIPDMVRPGITGLLAPPEDVAALGVAIVELLRDAGRRVEMSDNCRRIAVKEYSLEAQAQRYVELYEKVLAQNQASSAERHALPNPD